LNIAGPFNVALIRIEIKSIKGDRRIIMPNEIQNSPNDLQNKAKEFLGELLKVINETC